MNSNEDRPAISSLLNLDLTHHKVGELASTDRRAAVALREILSGTGETAVDDDRTCVTAQPGLSGQRRLDRRATHVVIFRGRKDGDTSRAEIGDQHGVFVAR